MPTKKKNGLPFELTPEGKRMINNPRRKEAAIKTVQKQNGNLTNGPGTTSQRPGGTYQRSATSKTTSQRPGGTYQRQKSTNNNSSSMSWSDFANASKNVERKRKEDAAAKERAAARRNHQEETGIDAAARKRSNLKAEMKAVGEYHRNMDQLTRQTVRGNAQQRDKATKARQAYENAFRQEHSNIDQKKLERKKMIQNKKGGR